MRKSILLLLSLSLVMLSCKEETVPSITINQSEITFSEAGGSQSVSFESNMSWTAKSSESWCTVSPASGEASNKGFTVTLSENDSYDARNCNITIMASSLSKTIAVNQSRNIGLQVTQHKYDLSNEAATIEVEVITNVEVEVIIPEAAKSWVSYIAARALRTESLLLNISANKEYSARTTVVYVKNKANNLQDTLTINQSANLGLLVTQDKYDLSNDATTIEVEIKANVDFDVVISDDWITKIDTRSLSSTKLNFNIAKNESYDSRAGTITIKQHNGSLSSIINVYQSQEDAIILSNNKEDLSNDSQTLEVELKTNVDVEVIIPAAVSSWVSYTPTRALRTETLLINIARNDTYERRTAQIYLKNMITNLQSTLTINQKANNKPLLISPANNSTNANKLPTFRWSEVKSAQGDQFWYKFEYSDNFTSWQYTYSTYDTFFNLPSSLAANKRYYWRVAAVSFSDAKTTYSEVYTFTTGTKTSYLDGEYKFAQTHIKGTNPSEVLFLGDGYISEDFEEGGQFDRDMNEGIESFFSVEPYKSYREYFTVYKQAGYSKERGVKQSDRNIFKTSKFGSDFTGSTIISADYFKVFEYAQKIPGVDYDKLRNILIVLVINENRYAGTSYTWSDGKAIAIVPVSRTTSAGTHFSNIVCHEAGGHGFGRLADEYVAAANYGKTITESEKNKLKSRYGNSPNVDLTADLNQIKWKHIIGVPGYNRVGTYEGGYYFSYGVWRPEVSSCMISNEKYYNAPSREAIVKRIYETAGLQYSFEAFRVKDLEKSPSRSVVMQTRSVNPATFVPLARPVMVE